MAAEVKKEIQLEIANGCSQILSVTPSSRLTPK
jgi:hypothetical protein